MEMRMGSNIRKRRKQRIKRILEMSGRSSAMRSGQAPSRLNDMKTFPLSASHTPEQLQDPEYVWKHGGNPWLDKDTATNMPWWNRLKMSMLLSAFMFAIVWGIFQLHYPWAKTAQAWISTALERNIDYAKISAWYEQHFQGSPALIPSFFESGNKKAETTAQTISGEFYRPVEEGAVTVFFDTTKSGIRIKSRHNEPVFALADGWVIYAGYTDEVGHTLIIRHAGGLESIYSGLQDALVKRGDWVKGGERVGKVFAQSGQDTGEWFFAVKKDNRYTDPLEVIALD